MNRLEEAMETLRLAEQYAQVIFVFNFLEFGLIRWGSKELLNLVYIFRSYVVSRSRFVWYIISVLASIYT